MNQERREELESEVVRHAKRFEPAALVRVLEFLGYDADARWFESSAEQGTGNGVVESVRFEASPRRAVITLHLGIGAGQGHLPTYFDAFRDQLPNAEPFEAFLQFFDHSLLSDFVAAIDDRSDLFGPWRARRDARFALLGLPSVSTLTWLFGHIFPELGVRVRRSDLRSRTDAHATILGESRLDGAHVLGTTLEAGRPGFEVELLAEDERDAKGRGWWSIVRDRLERRLLPHLADTDTGLNVVLVIVEHETWARLHGQGHLGYDRIEGAPGDHRIVVHREPAA